MNKLNYPPEELKEIHKKFQSMGHLLKEEKNKAKIFEKDIWKYWVCVALHWSSTSSWETFKASGSVYVNYFAVQKMINLSKDGDVLTGYQILLWKLMINFGWMKIK